MNNYYLKPVLAAAMLAFTLSACESKEEERQDEMLEQRADTLEEKADVVRERGEERADRKETLDAGPDHEFTEEATDRIEESAEKRADQLEEKADRIREAK